MKKRLQCFGGGLLVTILMITGMQASQVVTPYYSIRPQGVDAARELVGWTQQVNLADKDNFYGSMSLTAEYAQSFRSNQIAACLFGTNSCASDCSGAVINVSGSQVAVRGANDWLADNFYLPTDFQSTLNFNPKIENAIVDLDFYFGFDHWCQGFFLRVNLPINWTRWDLGFCESVTSTGVNNYDPGYFNSFDVAAIPFPLPGYEGIGVERSKLLTSFGAYASGNAPQGVVNTASVTNTNAIFDPLCYAKIGCGAHSTTQLADLSIILGWNFLLDEHYHVGVGLLARAPTGNAPEGVYLFEPISGNGKHWELGMHFTSHAALWACEDEQRSLGFYLDANITHLFGAKQTRTFDLKCKPLSRYMLAEKFMPNPIDLAGGPDTTFPVGAVVPSVQFANEVSPIANLTTQEVKVSIGVQGDVAAQFTYVNGGWNFDLGYNFWGRSCEQISCQTACSTTSTLCSPCVCPPSCTTNACANVAFAPNTWGIKGDAYVYGFANLDAGLTPVPLSATESAATINAGTNIPGGFTIATNPNGGIDNPQLAWDGTLITDTDLDADPLFTTQTNTSINPILIACSDFNAVGNRGISNKIYTHLSYNWSECDKWNPYLGVGAFGEFGSNGGCDFNTTCSTQPSCKTSAGVATCPSSCNTSCSTSECIKCALSQWGVWVKGGVSF